MASWQGDQSTIQQLCQAFEAASSPVSKTQQQVVQVLQQFSQLPDLNMYLVSIFVQIPNLPLDVRQRSGLYLKSSITRSERSSIQPAVAEHILAQALAAMADSERAIRQTAGTILTSMVQKIGFSACGRTLEQLVEALGHQNQAVVDGSLSAICKIVEDGVAVLASVGQPGSTPAATQEAQLFVTWANGQVIPRMLDAASPSSPEHVRKSSLECLNHFALGRAFASDKYGMQQHAPRYVQSLGGLANDTSPDILQPVCKGFACIIEDWWSCLTPQYCEVILKFMLKASQNPEYEVRLQALAVWAPCAGQPDSWGTVQSLLQELVPVLVSNMVYADADYMILEPSQVENDNAGVADSLDSIKPRFHAESNNVDGDEDDSGKVDRASHGWGAEWTARKAAASSLDELSSVFPDMVQIVLPQIEQKLNHSSWEQQEAGVLALGAIGVHCQGKLQQFLPAVLGLLLRLCDSPQPLLRSISCWCVSRFGGWIFHAQNPSRQEVSGSVLKVILPRCLDRNKRVQEASISALMTLTEHGKAQLVPYLDDIVQTVVKALQLYQLNNQRILYDTVSALVWAVGRELGKPQYMQAIVEPVFQRFQAVPDNDVLALPLCECVASLSQVLGELVASALTGVVTRSLRSVNEIAMASQVWEQRPEEYERPPVELLACCCDLYASILEGLQEHARGIVQQFSLLSVIGLALRNKSARVRQSGFWLMAIGAGRFIDGLLPHLPELMPLCVQGLEPTASLTVSMNAVRAIGEVCQRVQPEVLNPFLGALVPALLAILQRGNIPQWQMRGHNELLRGVCTAMNQLRQRTAVGQQWGAVVAGLPADLLAKLQRNYGLSP